jgi:hypothetical protein
MKITSLFDLMLRSLALTVFWTLFCLAAIPVAILRYAYDTLTRCLRVDQNTVRGFKAHAMETQLLASSPAHGLWRQEDRRQRR